MRNHLLRLAAIVLWSVGVCSAGIAGAQAQTTATQGMGATSPLGMSPDTASSGSGLTGGNIPLGATGINTAGVSPLIIPCPSAGSNAAFDGGGSAVANNCDSGASNNSGLGTDSMLGTTGTTSGSPGTVVGSGVPLGATDLGTPGESQVTSVPGVTPCLQSMTPSQGSSSGTGLTASTVNGGC